MTRLTSRVWPTPHRQCRASRAQRRRDLVLSDSAEMTATPSAPAAITAAAFSASMPAIPQSGKSGARFRSTSATRANPSGPIGALALLFRPGRIDAADAGIIDKRDRRRRRLRHGLDRQSDDRVRAKERPRVFGRHVIRSDMHAVGLNGERHVDTVVNDERYREWLERRLDRPRRLDMARVSLRLSRNCTKVAPPSAARRARSAERVSAGPLGVDDGVEAEVDRFQDISPLE